MTNNTKNIIFIILFVLGFQNTSGQDLNEDYMLFSKIDDRTEYLEFKSDSIVTRKPYYFRNGCGLANLQSTKADKKIYKDYRYIKQNDTIRIYDFQNSSSVDFRMKNERFFENADLGIVYVLRKFYDEFPDVAVSFENEIYWLDSPETSNGIIKKGGKKNRKLTRIMRNKDTTNTKAQVYKGYQAFEKFGYEYVFGIIEVSEK